MRVICRAYVVHGKGVKGEEARKFAKEVQKWIEPKVAKHKYLRGGVVVTDSIPKRYDSSITYSLYELTRHSSCIYSAAGKILRRELRERAKKEILSEPEYQTQVKAKL